MTKKKSTYKRKATPKKIVLPKNLRRRDVRYIMFRIKRDVVDTMDRDLRIHAGAIKAHFDKEMEKEGLLWGGFTFSWDVSPSDPYKIIKKDLRVWVAEGGSFLGRPPGMDKAAWAKHVLGSMLQNWHTPPQPLDPPAFTSQA
ncbi:MAG: hypothetical protein KAI64_02355 [Thermoplasmata archaeon]|nr:hypothetical protein [Thermoplasmata archaeon]